jgi:cysteine synthase A
MIEDAGVTTLVEPTSGNLGLGIVLIALRNGYRFVAVMPAQYSLGKQILLRYMGAELYLTGRMNSGNIWRYLIFHFLFGFYLNSLCKCKFSGIALVTYRA